MKFLYILPVIGVLFIFAQSNEAFGQDVKTEDHDGLGGWACWTDSSVMCNGINKYPITVSQDSHEGRQSIHVSGDPSSNTVACAKKIISSNWFIEKIELELSLSIYLVTVYQDVIAIMKLQ